MASILKRVYRIFNGTDWDTAHFETDSEQVKHDTTTVKAKLDTLKSGALATVVNNLTTTAANTVLDGRQGKALNDKITAINSALVTVRTVNEWTMTEYPNGLIEAWRYTTLSSASGAKTNTLSLPTPMKDSEYGVKISPIFNGHLCHAVWAGSKTGADGRTKTTVQISMDSTDSDSNVGVFVFISGYRQ
ncbi:MAG TPA: hypothetical protein IAA00_01710 [Candidatus Blautia ornithocaccae]|mgnify:CR=1 FL=1|nr:hypothetical protein [Candidatus Blautia ornithocaccae]